MRPLALMLVVLLAGCERVPWGRSDAEDVLHAYLDALVEGDTPRAYRYLSGADRGARTEGEWHSGAPRYADYRVVRVDEYADLATALVEVVPAARAEASTPAPVSAGGGDPGRSTSSGEETARTESFTLVREGTDWKVYLGDAAAGPPVPAPDGSPDALRARAPAAPPATAERASAPAPAVAPTGVHTQREGLELYALEAGYYRSYSGRSVPGVEFKLRNRSGRTVTRAVVTVYFLDAAGNPIWEEKYFPVRTDPEGFLNTPALKPGYIWQVERGKFLLAESVPEEWRRGAVRAEITEIQFAQDAPPG